MTPIDFGVKGKGHIDLVGKNSFRSITKEFLGLGTLAYFQLSLSLDD
jgi:hypothetical protein